MSWGGRFVGRLDFPSNTVFWTKLLRGPEGFLEGGKKNLWAYSGLSEWCRVLHCQWLLWSLTVHQNLLIVVSIGPLCVYMFFIESQCSGFVCEQPADSHMFFRSIAVHLFFSSPVWSLTLCTHHRHQSKPPRHFTQFRTGAFKKTPSNPSSCTLQGQLFLFLMAFSRDREDYTGVHKPGAGCTL